MRQWFAQRRGWFSERFQIYIDTLIASAAPVEAYLFDDERDAACSEEAGDDPE